MVSLVKRLTSNYTVSCEPLTTPPLNTTTAPKNRTKIITPKWKLTRPDYFGSGLPINKHHRKPHNHAIPMKMIGNFQFFIHFLVLLSVINVFN